MADFADPVHDQVDGLILDDRTGLLAGFGQGTTDKDEETEEND